jgi:hypothetical protein
MSASLETDPTTYHPTDLRVPQHAAADGPAPDQAEQPDQAEDLESLLPQLPDRVEVAGVPCVVNRIRTRELMLLARVLTRGVGANLRMVDFDSDDVDSQIMGLLIVAIPEAGDEILDLIRALVRPEEKLPDKDPRAATFHAEMANPDMDTTLDVLAVLVRQEKETFPLLVGKVKVLFAAASAVWRKQETESAVAGAAR